MSLNLVHWGMLLLAAWSLVSCETNDPDREEIQKSNIISFSTKETEQTETRANGKFVLREKSSCDTLYVTSVVCDGINPSPQKKDKPTTKAAPIDKSNFYSRLRILGYRYQPDEASALPDTYIDDILTGKIDDIAWAHESGKTYFWPGADYQLRFFSYAPTETAGLTGPATAGETTLTYTVPATVAEQKDLIVARTDMMPGNTNTAPTSLQFKHITSAVQFVVGDDLIEAGSVIKCITLKGIESSGSYDMATGEWDLSGTRGDFTQTLDRTIAEGVQPDDILAAGEQTFMMLPQTLDDNTSIEVALQNADGSNRTLSASLNGQEWPIGETVTYRLSIQPDSPDIGVDLIVLLDDMMTVDAHFLSFRVDVNTSEGATETGTWTITSNHPKSVFFKDTAELTAFQREHYWVDEDKGVPEYTATTPKGLQVYLTENASLDTDRDITLHLSNTAGTVTKTIKQLHPAWNSDQTIGCEQIEEIGENSKMTFPWGFNPENYKEIYQDRNNAPGQITQYREWVQSAFAEVLGKTGYITIHTDQKGPIITIDYAKATKEVATSLNDGHTNTKELFNYNGTDFDAMVNLMNQFAEEDMFVKVTEGDESAKNRIDVENFAAKVAVKKNRVHKRIQTVTSKNGKDPYDIEMLYINDDDFNWYLPALEECEKAYGPETIILEGNYWSSTSVTGNTSEAYDMSGEVQSRAEWLKVNAVRRRDP